MNSLRSSTRSDPRQSGPGAAGLRQRDAPRWVAPVVLATPFLLMVAVLRGMTATLSIFHGSDELVYQYPTILRFARQLPAPDLHSYRAAQTPLFHLVMAYVGKVIGLELWRLRLVEVLISYLLALAVLRLLERRVGIEHDTALVLTLLFALSPYVFGYSFRLMTDNLALLFSVLALDRLEQFRAAGSLGAFAVGGACAGAAVLTRQSTAFLFGVALIYGLLLGPPRPPFTRLLTVAVVAIAAVPAVLLFLNWHGLVPPGGDPSSCGLCSARAGATGLELPTTELSLATLGLYGAILFAPGAVAWLRRRRRAEGGLTSERTAWLGALIAAIAGVVLVAAAPASPGSHTAGALWRAAAHLPTLAGSSLLFWILVPLSGAVLWIRVRAAPRPWALCAFVACFLVSTLVIRFPWQKYVDPLAILVLLMSVRRRELASPRMLVGAALLAAAFIAYAADHSTQGSAPVTDRQARVLRAGA